MHCKYVLIGFTVATMATGCKSLNESIDQRVTVSEECRDTLSTPPLNIKEHPTIATIFVGKVGSCDLVNDETLLPMCSLAHIRTRHGIAPLFDPVPLPTKFADLEVAMNKAKHALSDPTKIDPKSKLADAIKSLDAPFDALSYTIHQRPERIAIWKYFGELRRSETAVPSDDVPQDLRPTLHALAQSIDAFESSLVPVIGQPELGPYLDAFDRAVFDLRGKMMDLANNISNLDHDYKEVLATLAPNGKDKKPRPDYAARTRAMQHANAEALELKRFVAAIQQAYQTTRLTAQALSARLPQQARVELTAWENNLRIQLAQLEQLLSGDVNVLFNAGVRDEVLTHVARRSLELLHGAMKPADAVINRLDEKAYGAVSVGYLVFGPDIQKAVNNAYDKVEATYKERHKLAKGETEGSANSKTFLWELKRAACDNLTQGTQFSMLSELVDTMLVMRVGSEYPSVATQAGAPTPDQNNPFRNDASVFPSPPAATGLPLRKAVFIMERTAAVEPGPSSKQNHAPTVTPLSVYAVNEWMARQQLLTEKLSASLANPPASGSQTPVQLPDVETVDEGRVKQIADAATAKAIDDAARQDPTMLDALPAGVAPGIQNSVNVVTAANAVSYASAVLNANISVSNVNTFKPTNSNTFSPVITVAAPAGAAVATSPCTAIDFGAVGISCADNGGNLVLGFSSHHFKSDSCMPDDLEPALTAMGNLLKGYRSRSGIGYRAAVDGYASLPSAHLARCPRVTPAPARLCKYVNGMRQTVSIVGCDDKRADLNLVLSAQRAWVAAEALERAADGAVVVDGLQALGKETAARRGPGAAVSLDQAVMIRLTPTVRP